MKKIVTQIGPYHTYRFFLLEHGNIGYIVIMSDDKLEFEHTVCCWGGPPTQKIAQGVLDSRDSMQKMEKIIMCSSEGGSHGPFGADASFSDLSNDEVERIKRIITLYLPGLSLLITQEKIEAEKAKMKEKRTSETSRLLRDFRYQDAKTHCEIHGLDYDLLLQESIK